MDKKQILVIIATAIIAVGVTEFRHVFFPDNGKELPSKSQSTIHSQYAGEETRGIKSLSKLDIEGLQTGAGTALGGLAKLAELNGYPGPRHVLDAIDAGEFEATPQQKKTIQQLYDEMRPQAIDIGLRLVEVERELNDAFVQKSISEASLQNKLEESARIYAELRFVHLKYHIAMMTVLTPDQIANYNELRGYTSDPCKNIPEGHDTELWNRHNNCV